MLYNQIEQALCYISADIPRDEWVKIGMAIKSELPQAFELFDEWSKTGRTYNSKDARATWDSIKSEGGITIKSLFFTAQKYGFNGNLNSFNRTEFKNREFTQNELNDQNLTKFQSTSTKSQKVWHSAQPATEDHPYLIKKKVLPHGIGEVSGDNSYIPYRIRGEERYLVIPLYDIFGTIWSVQFISEIGQKAFIKGKLTPDAFFCFGEATNKIYIVEGFATGAAFYQYSGQTVYCAFNAYRLSQVGTCLRTFYPYAEIFYIADDDWAKTINTGVIKAKEAAALTNAKVFIPDFEGIDRTALHSDFNDWYLCRRAYGSC